MASYYYLIASLPTLNSDDDMPMTYEEFLQNCQGNVSEETYKRLESLTLSSSEGPLLKEWAATYGMLIKELNSQRSMALGKPYPSGFDKDGTNTQMVTAALSAKTPLESEQILLDYEFELLDTLVGLHQFDDYVLFGYALKLKLLERRSCFEKEKGQAEFQHLFDQVQQRVYSL
ncbi:MAG: DUF2764 family protein [Eubacterium sp.]|nr:DUF2764 family protein [Bacillota bacterium]MCR4750857.1 DUF2764 family protein [Eubacterium sp.]